MKKRNRLFQRVARSTLRLAAIARIPLLAAALTAGSAQAVSASVHRAHGVHQHGLAQLNVAVDGSVVEIELIAPAINIVGFEHAPRNDAQRRALAQALTALRNGEDLFRPSAEAACRLIEAEVEIDTELENAEKDRHQAHGHGEAHHDHHGGHAELSARYRFLCEQPQRLQSIRLTLFERFPGNESVQVQLLTPSAQRLLKLTAGRADIRL